MSCRFVNANTGWSNSAIVPTLGTLFTVCAWGKSIISAGTQALVSIENGAGNVDQVTLERATLALDAFDGNTGTNAPLENLGTGAWAFAAMTYDNVTLRSYKLPRAANRNFQQLVQGSLVLTGLRPASFNTIFVGSDSSGEFWNGALSRIKIFSAVLSADEILHEAMHWAPQRRQDLFAWYPATTPAIAGIDFGPNQINLTLGSQPNTLDDEPPAGGV